MRPRCELGSPRPRCAAPRVGRVAAVGSDARPHLVPVCFAVEHDTIVSAVDAKPKTTPALRRLDNITANPPASLLAREYSDDGTRLWWVRADGDARVVSSGREHDSAVERLAEKYPQYRANQPTGA